MTFDGGSLCFIFALFIILITQPLVLCLRKKCKNILLLLLYFDVYYLPGWIVSFRRLQLVTHDILHAATQFYTCSTVKNRPRQSYRVFVVVVIFIPHQLQARLQLPQQLLLFPRQICPCVNFGCVVTPVRHMTGNDEDYLRKIPRVVLQKSALYKGPL